MSGETLYARVELVGFKDAGRGNPHAPPSPRPRPKVYGVTTISPRFYEFSEDTSIHIGNLVGYELAPRPSPFSRCEHVGHGTLGRAGHDGFGQSYTVGRIIERLVAQMNGTVVVFDPTANTRALGKIRTNPA